MVTKEDMEKLIDNKIKFLEIAEKNQKQMEF